MVQVPSGQSKVRFQIQDVLPEPGVDGATSPGVFSSVRIAHEVTIVAN